MLKTNWTWIPVERCDTGVFIKFIKKHPSPAVKPANQ